MVVHAWRLEVTTTPQVHGVGEHIHELTLVNDGTDAVHISFNRGEATTSDVPLRVGESLSLAHLDTDQFSIVAASGTQTVRMFATTGPIPVRQVE